MPPQRPEHAVAHAAIFKCGVVSLPLSRLCGPDALRHRLADSEVSVFLIDRENVGKVLEIWRSACPPPRRALATGRRRGR